MKTLHKGDITVPRLEHHAKLKVAGEGKFFSPRKDTNEHETGAGNFLTTDYADAHGLEGALPQRTQRADGAGEGFTIYDLRFTIYGG